MTENMIAVVVLRPEENPTQRDSFEDYVVTDLQVSAKFMHQ